MKRDLRAPVDRPEAHLLTEIREGIDFILANPPLRVAILFWGVTSILTAPLVTALAVHVTRDLGEQPSVLGLLLAAYGIGTVLGSFLTGRQALSGHVAPILLGGNVITGLALVIIGIRPEISLLVGASVIAGIAQSMVLVTYVTVRTTHSPDELLGRVGSTARTISLGLQPIGLLAGGALIDLTSGSTTLAVMGLSVIAVGLAFAPVAALRRASLMPR